MLPTEQPIFEVERYLAKSHRCETQKAIEIILRIGVDICDSHVSCPETTLAERHLSRKPLDMSRSASGGYGSIGIDMELFRRGLQAVAINK